jgi:DNA-binding NarL/FixJ family response regulator
MRIEIEDVGSEIHIEVECDCGKTHSVHLGSRYAQSGTLRLLDEIPIDETRGSDPAEDSERVLATRFGLTPIEAQILERMVRGRTDREIALELEMPIAAVRAGVRRTVRRLGARNRLEAACKAARSAPPDRAPWPIERRPNGDGSDPRSDIP